MKKQQFLTIVLILLTSFILCGFNGMTQKDFYGWWKPESPTVANNNPCFITENEITFGKTYKITKWIKEDDSYKIAFDNIVATLQLTKNGNLIITPQVYLGSSMVFVPTTEEEVKADEAKRKERLKNMTKSTPDPF